MLREKAFGIQVRELCRRAEVSSPTFYRHYSSVDDAVQQIESELVVRFAARLGNLNDMQTGRALTQMLFYVARNQDYFELVLARGNVRVIVEMLNVLKPVLMRSWPNYGCAELARMWRTYCGAAVGVIVDWAKVGFKTAEIENYVRHLTVITENFGRWMRELGVMGIDGGDVCTEERWWRK